jgi:hypothetical protein
MSLRSTRKKLEVESSKLICVELSGDYQLNLSLATSFEGAWTRMECRLFPVASVDYDFFSFFSRARVQNFAWSEERRRKRKKHHHIYCFDATLIDTFGVLDSNAVHSEKPRS